MSKNYYVLVAGLVEYTLESEHKGFDAPAIREEIKEVLSPQDREYVDLFYTFYDVENVISALNGKETYNALGNLSPEEIAEAVAKPVRNAEEEPEIRLPEELIAVIRAYQATDDETELDDDEKMIDTSRPIDVTLWETFYRLCSLSPCRYIREWYAFNLTLRNIIAAYIARSNGLSIKEQLVGENEVTEALSRSSAADFGLRNEIEYIEQITSLLDIKNIIEKEHQLDMIRWRKADEITTFDYFNINFILGYLTKVNIIHRWAALDAERGREMFRALIKELSENDALRRAETEALEKTMKS